MSKPPQPQITLPEIPDDIIEEMTTYLFNSGCIQPIPSTKRSITHIPTIITPTPVPKPFYDKITYFIDYTGIDIEFVADNENENVLSRPRIVFEYPTDGKLRVLIWDDKDNEDYTKEIVFDI